MFCIHLGGGLRNEHQPFLRSFTEESDVDVLVEFDPAHLPGMIRLCGMERELSGIVGRKVDMRTPNDLSRYFRDEVMNTAVVQYAA